MNKQKEVEKKIKIMEESIKKNLNSYIGKVLDKKSIANYIYSTIHSLKSIFGEFKFVDKIGFKKKDDDNGNVGLIPTTIETALLIAGIDPELIETATIDGNTAIIHGIKHKYDSQEGMLYIDYLHDTWFTWFTFKGNL